MGTKRSRAAALAVASCLAVLSAVNAMPHSPAALKDRYADLRLRFERNAFGRPLALEAREAGGELRGDAYALLPHAFPRVREALDKPEAWCELLTLPFNMQKCEADGETLEVHIGRKPESPLAEATRLRFRFAVAARGDDLLEVRLDAPEGPAGTRDYRIAFAAAPVDEARTLVHFAYGYGHSALSRLALQAYLATSGANKVGFTSEGVGEDGKPRLVGGMRGVIERNTMRYFLAVEAYLAASGRPAQERRRASLEHWFAAVERYPRQLGEMSREKYLRIKGIETGDGPSIRSGSADRPGRG